MKKIIFSTLLFILIFSSCDTKNHTVVSSKETDTIDSLINYNPCSREELLLEIDEKLARVKVFLDENKLEGILLTTTTNFSWITAGIGDNHISLVSEVGPASLLIMKNGDKYVVGDNAEIPHLMDEDLNGLNYKSLQYMWNENKKLDFVKQVATNGKIGTDIPMDGLEYIESKFARIRYKFTDSEIKKYRWLCEKSAESVAHICRTIQPGMSDKYIETMTSNALLEKGIRPTVILIGLDERITKYCHFPPVGKKLEKYAFVNVCARKWGMITSVGRYVYFGEIPKELQNAVKASAQISAKMIHNTHPGVKSNEMFEKTVQWYAEAGYPDEWKKIHSGGAIGYMDREWVATGHDFKEVFLAPQAFAWNPFVSAALSFHTILSFDDHNEILTEIIDWPVIPVELDGVTYNMPTILKR